MAWRISLARVAASVILISAATVRASQVSAGKLKPASSENLWIMLTCRPETAARTCSCQRTFKMQILLR